MKDRKSFRILSLGTSPTLSQRAKWTTSDQTTTMERSNVRKIYGIFAYSVIYSIVIPCSDHGSQSTERSDFIQSVRIDGHLL